MVLIEDLPNVRSPVVDIVEEFVAICDELRNQVPKLSEVEYRQLAAQILIGLEITDAVALLDLMADRDKLERLRRN